MWDSNDSIPNRIYFDARIRAERANLLTQEARIHAVMQKIGESDAGRSLEQTSSRDEGWPSPSDSGHDFAHICDRAQSS